MTLPKNKFKGALKSGRQLPGLWSSIGSNIVAEILAHSDFDWVTLDTEHTHNETPALVSQMQAMKGGNASVLVRPAWNDAVLIKRILDIGAQSLVIPFVQNAEEARAAVAATRYPPEGIRGAAGGSRAASYGRNKNYLHEAANEIAVIVQIETGEAVQEIEAIASVPGVDAVFIGPSDLSASLGHLNNPNHEDVQVVIKGAIEKLIAMGKPGGTLAFNPVDAQRYFDWGFTFVAVGSDVKLLTQGSHDLLAKFK